MAARDTSKPVSSPTECLTVRDYVDLEDAFMQMDAHAAKEGSMNVVHSEEQIGPAGRSITTAALHASMRAAVSS